MVVSEIELSHLHLHQVQVLQAYEVDEAISGNMGWGLLRRSAPRNDGGMRNATAPAITPLL